MYRIALVAGGAEVALRLDRQRRPARVDRGLSVEREAPLRGVHRPRGPQRARRRRRPSWPSRRSSGLLDCGAASPSSPRRSRPSWQLLDRSSCCAAATAAPTWTGASRRRRHCGQRRQPRASSRTPRRGRSSATSSTCPSSAPSSSPPSTARIRSPIAVSTGGASPALAQRLRDEIAEVVRPEHAALAVRLRDLRPWAKANLSTYAAAARLLRRHRRGGARMTVYLVGAGPGDPGLITARAARSDPVVRRARRTIASLRRSSSTKRPHHACGLARRGRPAGVERASRPLRPRGPRRRPPEGRRPVRLRAWRRGGACLAEAGIAIRSRARGVLDRGRPWPRPGFRSRTVASPTG